MKRILAAVAGAGIGAVAVFGAVQAAATNEVGAEQPQVVSAPQDVTAPQDAVEEVPVQSEALRSLLDKASAWQFDSGFAGLEIDAATNVVRVFWRGKAPAELRALATQQPASLKLEIDETAVYSREELEAVRDEILASPLARDSNVVMARVDQRGQFVLFVFEGDAEQVPDIKAKMFELTHFPAIDVAAVPVGSTHNFPGVAAP